MNMAPILSEERCKSSDFLGANLPEFCKALAKFLQNQCIATPPLVINIISSILHVGWCDLLALYLYIQSIQSNKLEVV